MREIEDENELKIKPAIVLPECLEMLDEAMAYIAKDSPKQAGIMHESFYENLKILETMPKIGTLYKDGIRKFNLGKFRKYNIYYREQENIIEILGIWHTSRGILFEETPQQ
jgi:plasmid stabilization system protein ParE